MDGDEAQAAGIGRYALFAAQPNGDQIRVADERYLIVWRIHRDVFTAH